VLEASGEVSVNNEVYTYKMTGIVSPKDIDPRDRSVESTYVQSRRIDLRVVGAARDALKRGYITALLEWFQPI
ncbi:flagellar basal body L-ring protein FlgH, partial [bacterium]|nr:flagellar basal body L-ring protein FlgH [bacterium]